MLGDARVGDVLRPLGAVPVAVVVLARGIGVPAGGVCHSCVGSSWGGWSAVADGGTSHSSVAMGGSGGDLLPQLLRRRVGRQVDVLERVDPDLVDDRRRPGSRPSSRVEAVRSCERGGEVVDDVAASCRPAALAPSLPHAAAPSTRHSEAATPSSGVRRIAGGRLVVEGWLDALSIRCGSCSGASPAPPSRRPGARSSGAPPPGRRRARLGGAGTRCACPARRPSRRHRPGRRPRCRAPAGSGAAARRPGGTARRTRRSPACRSAPRPPSPW